MDRLSRFPWKLESGTILDADGKIVCVMLNGADVEFIWRAVSSYPAMIEMLQNIANEEFETDHPLDDFVAIRAKARELIVEIGEEMRWTEY